MSKTKLYLFGTPRIEVNGVTVQLGRRKAMALLAYLALEGDTVHSREDLGALLWPDLDRERALVALRQSIYAIRKNVNEAGIESVQETVRLHCDATFHCDVQKFRRLARLCKTHPHDDTTNCPDCTTRLVDAIEIAQDTFMAGFGLEDCPAFEEWQFFQTEALNTEIVGVLGQLVEQYRALEEWDTAIEYARRRVELTPTDEAAHCTLMRLYAQNHQRSAALRQFDLCAQILRTELNTMPSMETEHVAKEIRLGQHSQNGQPVASATWTHNLPIQTTNFVGRSKELGQLQQLLRSPNNRLLTMIGPGGSGKTRLSIEAGHAHLPNFSDGIFFVSLARLHTAGLLAHAITESLQLSTSGELPPVEVLLNDLRDKRVLLILDNFEHLRAGTGLVERLLAETRHTVVLVTSRERLNIQHERLFPINGLDLPPAGKSVDEYADLDEYGAIQMFVQCARRVQPDFALTASNAQSVTQLCQMVDGMPLAIELATPWLRIMSVTAMAEGISDRLKLLSTSMAGIPERHRSMVATFDHSWHLLSEDEQAILCRLSVFRGGFLPDAAQTVAGASPSQLLSFADKSWLRTRDGRIEMLELARQYCQQKLQHSESDALATRRRHSHYFGRFMREQETDIYGGGQLEATERISAEIDNVRVGWNWAIEHEDTDAIDHYLESLSWIGFVRGWHRETLAMFRQAMHLLSNLLAQNICDPARPDLGEVGVNKLHLMLARTLSRPAIGCSRAMGHEEGLTLCQQALSHLSSLHPETSMIPQATIHRTRGYTLIAKSLFLIYGPDPDRELRPCVEMALAEFAQADDAYGIVWAQWLDGWTRFLRDGDFATAESIHLQVLNSLRKANEYYLCSQTLGTLGYMYRVQGMYDKARMCIDERLKLARAMQIADAIGLASMDLGWLATFVGEYERATACFQEGLAISRSIGHPSLQGYCLEGLGWTAYRCGDIEAGRKYFRDVLSVFQFHYVAATVRIHACLGILAAKSGDLAEAQRDLASPLKWPNVREADLMVVFTGVALTLFHSGDELTALQLLAFIEHHPDTTKYILTDEVEPLLAQLRTMLPQAAFTATYSQGEQMTFDKALALAQMQCSN